MDSPEIRRFTSASAYNSAYPRCQLPAEPAEWHRLRSYHRAMQGLEDDLTGSGASMTIDFLPGGPPLPGELDRFGTVVASRWRSDSFLVLAEDISLHLAWRAIIRRWPVRLSEARAALVEITADT